MRRLDGIDLMDEFEQAPGTVEWRCGSVRISGQHVAAVEEDEDDGNSSVSLESTLPLEAVTSFHRKKQNVMLMKGMMMIFTS